MWKLLQAKEQHTLSHYGVSIKRTLACRGNVCMGMHTNLRQ